METKKASIIVRVRNEAKNLEKLFQILHSQTEKNFEIIAVDNDSEDNSVVVAENHGARVVNIPYASFTYPKASNLGCEAARGQFLVFLSAHSFPLSKTWLADGLRHFKELKIAGVYGPTLAYPDSNFIEKMDKLPGTCLWSLRKIVRPRWLKWSKMGLLGTTNAVIPKKLWQEHHFDESYAAGGEDMEWAKHFMARGYKIICDPKFSVRHAHRLASWLALKKQYEYWRNTTQRPKKFIREEIFSFRKDGRKFIRPDSS